MRRDKIFRFSIICILGNNLKLITISNFSYTVRPGQNTIRRRSVESTVTIPFERTFRDLDTNRPDTGSTAEAEFNFCGCGWPQHMLVPKGLPEGLGSQLFVMVSDYELDRVDQDLVGTCNDAASFCGVRDRLYPDRRPMGYPFDRLPRSGSDRLSSFLTPNMLVQDVNVVHVDQTVARQRK